MFQRGKEETESETLAFQCVSDLWLCGVAHQVMAMATAVRRAKKMAARKRKRSKEHVVHGAFDCAFVWRILVFFFFFLSFFLSHLHW